MARAMPTRAFWPPDSWCGKRSSRFDRQADHAGQFLAAGAQRVAALDVAERMIGSAMARAAVKRGLRLSVGSWNTIWMRLRSGSRAKALGGIAPMSSPSNTMRPEVGSSSRITIIEVVDLPQPDSPTRPTLSPWPTVKLMPSTARKSSASDRRLAREQLAERRRSRPGADIPSPAFRRRAAARLSASSGLGAAAVGGRQTAAAAASSGQQIAQRHAEPRRRAHQLAWYRRAAGLAKMSADSAVSTTWPFSITTTRSQ